MFPNYYEYFKGIVGAYHVNHLEIYLQLIGNFTTESKIKSTCNLDFDCIQLLKQKEKDHD